MKTNELLKLAWFTSFLLLMTTACQKDDSILPNPDTPIPVELPVEQSSDLLGVRLVVKSIVCFDENDGSNHTEDIYGYLETWADYDNDYTPTQEGYEIYDKALMWYVAKNYYTEIAENDTLPVGSIIDFIINRNDQHKVRINLKGHIREFDAGGGNDENLGIRSIDLNVEQLNPNVERELIFEQYHSDRILGWTRLKIVYYFENFDPRSTGVLPDGYQATDLFNKIDLNPDLPVPTSYEAAPPAISERLIVGQKEWSNFTPGLLEVKARNGDGPFYAYDLRNISTDIIFVQNGAPYHYPMVSPEYNPEDNKWYGLIEKTGDDVLDFERIESPTELKALQNTPRLQLTRFYKPIEIWRLPAGSSLSTTVEYSNSWERERYSEFSITVGIEIGPLSSELNSTFGSSWSYSGTISNSETMEYSAPEDQNVLYVVWQLWEEYRLVDENGDIFTDPGYEFRSMEVLTIPTEHIVPKGYLFPVQ